MKRILSVLAGALLCRLAAAVGIAAVGAGDLLESRYALRTDLSFNHITTETDATRAVLRALEKNVHAYSVASEGNELNDLCALLDRYQAATPRFTWSRERLSRNPLLLQWASDDLSDSAVTTDCLILRCEETGRTRVLTWDDYLGYGYNPESGVYEFTGLTYEKSLTEAILYVSSDTLPRLQLLRGHGELTDGEIAALSQKLRSANYELTPVNLKSGDTLAADAPLMILSPTMDVTEEELSQLLAFAQSGGSLFVTVDFTDPDELPNLYAFYRLYGVAPLPGVVVADSADRTAYYTNVAELTPQMNATAVTETLVAGQANFIIMAPARALDVVGADNNALIQEIVLQSDASAYRRTAEEGSIDLSRHADDPAGPFVLAVLSDRGFDGGLRSRAFFIGNSGMFLSDQIYNMTYSGEMLLQVLQHLQGQAPIELDILARDAARPVLDARGSLLPVLLLILPPLLIALLAAAVLLPRRYL